METRASYLAVGGFVLVLLTTFLLAVVWLAKVQLQNPTDRYLVYFTGAVSGLQPGSPVRYLGIPVGTVTDLRIDPDDTTRVQATLEVTAGTPVKTDSVASLELQGLTGGAFVQVGAGSGPAPLLADQAAPRVIASRPSNLEAVFAATPRLLDNVLRLSDDLAELLNPDNRQAIGGILRNVEISTDRLASTLTRVDAALAAGQDQAGDVARLVGEAVGQARRMIDSFDQTARIINREVGQGATDFRELLRSFRRTSDQLAGIAQDNREPLREFTSGGLYEASLLINELRGLSADLSRFLGRLERDPANALIRGSSSGVEVRR
jgi:phospholipid/cholesterol/gamma-HCH transport system substrate-binding protein